MRQFTIHTQDPALLQRLEQYGNERGWLLNQAANQLLGDALGVGGPAVPVPIGDRIRAYSGAMPAEEAERVRAVAEEAGACW